MAPSATEGRLTGPHLSLFDEGWAQVLPPQPFLPRDGKVGSAPCGRRGCRLSLAGTDEGIRFHL
jgi:hypothetical protein